MEKLQDIKCFGDIEERKWRAYEAMVSQDYSSFDFGINDNLKIEWIEAGLTHNDLEIILVLFSVCQVLMCADVKKDIKQALLNEIMKEYILNDLLMAAVEHKEGKFYDDDIVKQTISNIEKTPEAVIDSLFIRILQQIQYR